MSKLLIHIIDYREGLGQIREARKQADTTATCDNGPISEDLPANEGQRQAATIETSGGEAGR